jgi:hypothetical protein
MSRLRVPWLLLSLSAALNAQTLGQFRIVDFAARAAIAVAASDGTHITTAEPHGLSNGAAVYIYQPLSLAQDFNPPGRLRGDVGNRGRGYFTVTVNDPTHFELAAEMYSGNSSGLAAFGVAAGDKIIPLTTYYLRQGPRVWLDGPVARGAWSASTTYRSDEMVTSNGASYLAIASNSNQQPPNPAYWMAIDPSQTGPGIFTASLRNTAGKAASNNLPFSYGQTLLGNYWPSSNSFDYSNVYTTGGWGALSAFTWFANGASARYNAALRLATQTEDLAVGTTACDETQAYCGGRTNIDYARLDAQAWLGALSTIYDTLTPAQKGALADRLLNDNEVSRNGIENSGTNCVNSGYSAGNGSLTLTSTSAVNGSGTGFTTLAGLQPGSVLLQQVSVKSYRVIGRVKSVDSDTRLTLEGAAANFWGARDFAVSAWVYTQPFGYQGAHTCGVIWLLKHHASSPRMIPGQEMAYGSNYPVNVIMDDSPRQNKATVALSPYIAAAMLLGNDDLRAVRLGEQAINYYMTQTMAQENKSRWTGFDGHGTQYGTDRTATSASNIAVVLKNSLTVTPPGITSGSYLKSILAAYQYAFWLGRPQYVQPWSTGYGAGTGTYTSERLSSIGVPMLLASTLYPDDPFAANSWDYLRKRRGDFGNLKSDGGWGSLAFLVYAVPFYDPLAQASAPSALNLQRAFSATDVDECISAGLYCRPDTGESIAISQTGWADTDTQVMIQAQSALPTWDDDNYGTAGSYTILQNNGSNSAYLLGGNGLATSGLYPSSGMEHGNTISFFNPATGKDMWYRTGSGPQYARLVRWAGDPVTGVADNSYAYAMIDLAPKIRDATQAYSLSNRSAGCFYQTAICAGRARIQRQVIHFKQPSGATYVVSYDDIAIAPGNLVPRAYFHYEISDSVSPYTDKRHPDWLTTFDQGAKAVVLTVPGLGRLSSAFLGVSGSARRLVGTHIGGAEALDKPPASSIALVRDQGDGTYAATTGLVGAAVPGSYRVTVCPSNDGTTCTTSRSAEWIAVHKPSTDRGDSMPPLDQPACRGAGGDCTALEIQDGNSPKVAIFARGGALLSRLTLVTTHSGKAQYVAAGLAPGTYTVTVGSTSVVTGAVVGPNDNTLSFQAPAGAVTIAQTGVGVLQITIGPSLALVVNSQQQMSGQCTFTDLRTSDCTTLLSWMSDAPAVATVSSSGLVTGIGEGSVVITASYLGAEASAVMTVKGPG